MTEPEAESDLRRRAAWLLVMLAVVAVLFIVVISAVVGSDAGGGDGHDSPGALDSATNTSTGSTPSTHHKKQRPSDSASHSRSRSSKPPVGDTSCPTQQTCILQSDIGHGVQAINDYRTAHGKPAVPGAVGAQAQNCAVRNGTGCSGGWAETELSTPDGQEAVQKILPFAHLLDPNMKSIEVGWAYDPKAKLYYFAIIRKD